jgi:hypothetical protein
LQLQQGSAAHRSPQLPQLSPIMAASLSHRLRSGIHSLHFHLRGPGNSKALTSSLIRVQYKAAALAGSASRWAAIEASGKLPSANRQLDARRCSPGFLTRQPTIRRCRLPCSPWRIPTAPCRPGVSRTLRQPQLSVSDTTTRRQITPTGQRGPTSHPRCSANDQHSQHWRQQRVHCMRPATHGLLDDKKDYEADVCSRRKRHYPTTPLPDTNPRQQASSVVR